MEDMNAQSVRITLSFGFSTVVPVGCVLVFITRFATINSTPEMAPVTRTVFSNDVRLLS
jgi:high-affinity nickel permease